MSALGVRSTNRVFGSTALAECSFDEILISLLRAVDIGWILYGEENDAAIHSSGMDRNERLPLHRSMEKGVSRLVAGFIGNFFYME